MPYEMRGGGSGSTEARRRGRSGGEAEQIKLDTSEM